MLRSWKAGVAVAAIGLLAAGLLARQPYPGTERRFDSGNNGLWIGHRWYTGRDVRTGAPVGDEEVTELAERLRRRGIRFAYVHAGPLRADGSIEDSAGPQLGMLRRAYPEGRFLAWLGARTGTIPLESEAWRRGVLASIERLRAEGFDGIHFNLEPLRDGHAGYLELLSAVRETFGNDTVLSQATPRSAVFGLATGPLARSVWSGEFYRATMALTDHSVLMAYNTRAPLSIVYTGFVWAQTRRLVDWACRAGSELLIGIPSFEDHFGYSDPRIENVRNASLGVRSALESFGEVPTCFRGVSVYANWVTDAEEWADYEKHWQHPGADGRPR